MGTKVTLVNSAFVIPVGVDDAGLLRPGVLNLPDLYTVPFGWRLEIKKFLLIIEDTDYQTIFASITKGPNTQYAFMLEGNSRLDATGAGFPALTPSAEWGVLPLWPQDQFNVELRFSENQTVGFRITNYTPLVRTGYIAAWGWKYLARCEDRLLGIV